MKFRGQLGISHIQLLIIIVMVSVVSTALLNLQMNSAQTDFSGYGKIADGNNAAKALEDIKYHLGLAGYALINNQKPLEIEKNEKSEIIRVRHNNICFEFYVDEENNLIKKVETLKKVIASNIISLKTASISGKKIVVTLSAVPLQENKEGKIETLSKSYSATIDLKSLI